MPITSNGALRRGLKSYMDLSIRSGVVKSSEAMIHIAMIRLMLKML
jgi:hypothetical protein